MPTLWNGYQLNQAYILFYIRILNTCNLFLRKINIYNSEKSEIMRLLNLLLDLLIICNNILNFKVDNKKFI